MASQRPAGSRMKPAAGSTVRRLPWPRDCEKLKETLLFKTVLALGGQGEAIGMGESSSAGRHNPSNVTAD